MKEYLNIILGSVIGVVLTVAWGVIKLHFRSKQHDTEIPKMKDAITVLEDKQTEGDKNIALLKQQVDTMDKKFDKFDSKMDNLITMLTK